MTPKTVALAIEICGDYSTINRCGDCQSLNIITGDAGRAKCPDCGAINLVPMVNLCECGSCENARKSALESLE